MAYYSGNYFYLNAVSVDQLCLLQKTFEYFAVIDWLLGAKFVDLYLIWRVWGNDFYKNSQIKKDSFYFFFTYHFFKFLLLHRLLY